MVFLKGSRKNKEKLEEREPALFSYFKTIWEIKQRHEIPSLPQQYLFGLMCCFTKDCPHPVCQLEKEGTPSKWYPEGPKLGYIPLPIPDPKYIWGNKSCTKCKELYAGHFLSSTEVLTYTLPSMSQPPSCMLKEFHQSLHERKPSQIMLVDIANKCMVPVKEVKFWLEHLNTVNVNRRRGAAKAAQTRRLKKHQQLSGAQASTTTRNKKYYCSNCEALYDDDNEDEYWIGCEECDAWFHGDCVGVTPDNEPDKYYCASCFNNRM